MHSDLLDKACARIQDLTQPAYIKDSALRYVAVNDAYAELFGLPASDFVDGASGDLAGMVDTGERKEKESRAIVFGSDEVAHLHDGEGTLRYEVHVERFLTENDHTYLFGTIEELVAARPVSAAAAQIIPLPAAKGSILNNRLLDDALDMLEMGIGIYDRADTLLYCNSQLVNYFSSLDIDVTPGISLTEILGYAYERRRQIMPRELADTDEGREAWIAQRMEPFRQPYWENINQLADGRWMRTVNKRLENGVLIAIRQDVTDFKEQETVLRGQVAETELFRAILEDLPAPVFVRNDRHELTYANHAYEQMLGDVRERYLGKTEAEMFPWAAERFWDENARVLSGENIDKSEDMTFPDGSVIPVLTRLRSIQTEDGSSYLVCSRTDVSLIKEAQAKAEKVSKDLQTILDSVPVGIGILNEQFVFEYASPSFYEFWDTERPFELPGRSYREFLGVNYDDGIYEGGARGLDAVYEARIAALADDNGGIPIEIRTRLGRQLLISGTRLTDGKLLLSHTDVTAMRRRDAEIQEARAALERHGALMRDATSAMSQGLLILHEGEVELSNDALPAMLEISAEMTAPGAQWSEIFRHAVRRGDFGSHQEAMATLRSLEANIDSGIPFYASFKIENRKWVQVEARQTSSDHWLAVFTDVTEAKMREEELTRLLQRAEAADRAKSEFLANMSHEIRTPMNGVLGMAELLAKSNLDTRQKTFIDIIVKSGNALLTIINDILDFSKIDAGQMKLRRAPFDPVEAIEDVATLLSSAAADKDIELIVRGDAAVRETVLGDAGRFRQIVTNLVGNAVKFTEKGHVFIDLKSEPVGASDLMLTIRIEDTGLGIPDEKLKTVFEKFSQVDTSSTRRHEGTGLGLAITSGLVDLFGGSVGVTSEVGRGSVFTVSLPFPIVAERKQETTLPINTSGARVLIVDDNVVNRRILTEQLSMWGFDTVAAESGAEGLAVLSEAARIDITVDAIVLDYHMPQMNGLDFAKALRRDQRFDGTGVIFLTSMDMASDESMFAELQIHAHLMKPARANLLRSTVIDVVRSVRSKRRMEAAIASEAGSATVSPAVVTSTPSTTPVQAAPSLDVLVAEDNEVNQIVFTQILQTTGWLFQIVRNGAEAVEAWQANDPAVIIMDVSMPIMNGHQATRRIRELEAKTGTHTPIIGVTAHALESDRELCFQAGMDDYLSKPISPEALEDKVRTWIGGARMTSKSR